MYVLCSLLRYASLKVTKSIASLLSRYSNRKAMNEGGSPTPANPPVYGPDPPGGSVPNVVGENTVQDGGSKVIPNDDSEKTSKEFLKRES